MLSSDVNSNKTSLDRDLIKDAKRAEFDIREFGFSLLQIMGLLICLMFEPTPSVTFEFWTVVIHTYAMVQTPLGIITQQAVYTAKAYAVTTIQSRRNNN